MHIKETDLKTILIDSGLVNEETFNKAKEEALRSNQTIGNVLIGRGDISEDYLTNYLANFFKVKKIDLKKVPIEIKTLEKVPESLAKSRNFVVFDFDEKNELVKVAMLDPADLEIIEYLRKKFEAEVEVYITSVSSLKFGLRQYKRNIGEEFSQIIKENISRALTVTGVLDLSKMAEAVPIITILDSIIEHAISLGASDIHFEPLEDKFLIRFRIEGILREILTLPKEINPILVARVKVLANLLIDVHNAPQDGRFRFEIQEEKIDVRVSVMPTFYGEKIVMRLLKGSARPFGLEELGLTTKNLKIVKRNIKKTMGMILVTGPTGCGKTTTLYALLHILNTPEVNIVTVEDPIEYSILRVNQTQINPKAGISFASGLRALLRQNPDIIMIGEIRDRETVDISINAALTGHLLLSTLHTNDAPTAIPRLIDMGAPPFLLASSLTLVMAQRLVRKICQVCVSSYQITEELKEIIRSQIPASRKKEISNFFYRGKGCKLCNFTGYHGQIGIFEVLEITDRIKNMMSTQVSADEIKNEAVRGGFTTMFEDGLEKAEAGITTIEEILRVVRE